MRARRGGADRQSVDARRSYRMRGCAANATTASAAAATTTGSHRTTSAKDAASTLLSSV